MSLADGSFRRKISTFVKSMTQNRSTAKNTPNQKNTRCELDVKVLRQADMTDILGAVDAEKD